VETRRNGTRDDKRPEDPRGSGFAESARSAPPFRGIALALRSRNPRKNRAPNAGE
jgi:hypothetical protein